MEPVHNRNPAQQYLAEGHERIELSSTAWKAVVIPLDQ